MATIPAPYAVACDPAARGWWNGLSAASRRAFERSWRDDERADPLHEVARRTAAFLNQQVSEREQPHDPMARELHRRGLAPPQGDDARAGWDWAMQDFYEHAVAHADFRDPALDRPTRYEGVSSLPEARTVCGPGVTETLAKGSWWAL